MEAVLCAGQIRCAIQMTKMVTKSYSKLKTVRERLSGRLLVNVMTLSNEKHDTSRKKNRYVEQSSHV